VKGYFEGNWYTSLWHEQNLVTTCVYINNLCIIDEREFDDKWTKEVK